MEEIFKALSSTPRRRILSYLAEGPMTAGEIADKFDMTKPSISKHLSVLKGARLIAEEKQGQFVHYRLVDDNLTNSLYGFLSNFCPQARKIKQERMRDAAPCDPTEPDPTET